MSFWSQKLANSTKSELALLKVHHTPKQFQQENSQKFGGNYSKLLTKNIDLPFALLQLPPPYLMNWQ
jgi:hypothetical protein